MATPTAAATSTAANAMPTPLPIEVSARTAAANATRPPASTNHGTSTVRQPARGADGGASSPSMPASRRTLRVQPRTSADYRAAGAASGCGALRRRAQRPKGRFSPHQLVEHRVGRLRHDLVGLNGAVGTEELAVERDVDALYDGQHLQRRHDLLELLHRPRPRRDAAV